MPGYGPKLPLNTDDVDGFGLTKSLKEVINQNLKGLVLTNPGEKVWDGNFGAGLRNFIFQPNVPHTYGEIETVIKKQVSVYMPFIQIVDIVFAGPDDNENIGENELNMELKYFIKPLGTMDMLSLSLINSKLESSPSEFGPNDYIT